MVENKIERSTHGQIHNSIRSTSSTMNGIHRFLTMYGKHPSCEAFVIINYVRDLDVSQSLEILMSALKLNRKEYIDKCVPLDMCVGVRLLKEFRREPINPCYA